MEYPEITQAEQNNKATGPDDVKGELYRALGRSEMCVGKLQTALQNIIDKDLKINNGKNLIHQTNTESQETNRQADETNCTN